MNLGQRLRDAKNGSISQLHDTSKSRASTQCDYDSSSTPQSQDSLRKELTLPTSESDSWSLITTQAFDPIDPILSLSPTCRDILDLDFSVTSPNGPEHPTRDISSLTILSPQSQPYLPLTVMAALYRNGEVLGIRCSVCASSRSPYPSPSHPLSLHPTEAQLQIIHPRWIDCLPFPKMRDSLVKLAGAFDIEELVKDLFTMASWTIEKDRLMGGGWENASWDVRAWKMEKAWAAKWGWLMI
jgi:hypothetical protein